MNPIARRITMLASAAATVLVLLPAPAALADSLRNVKPGEGLPEFVLATTGGEKLRSDDLKGNAVVLVFLSARQRSSEAVAAAAHAVVRDLRAGKDVALLYATADVSETGYFREHRDRTSVHEPLVLDFDRTLYGDLGLIVQPTTIVIDRDWKLAHVISGHKPDYDHILDAYVRHALGRIDDAELGAKLASERFERDRPADRIARHRAAARLLRKNGLLPDAEKELRAALAIDAAHADARLDLAAVFIAQDRVADATGIAEAVLAEQPYHRRGKLIYGIALYRADRLDEAKSVLEEALLLNPDPVHTNYYLGLIAEKRGDTTGALRHYRKALGRLLRDREM